MRKLLVFMLICTLFCPAALADVQSEISAPSTYSAVWQSNTGKTIITVDAGVEVPGVQEMMVYPTSQRVFTIDDLHRVATACFGDTPYGSLPSNLDSVTCPGANSDPTGIVIRAASENAAGNLALLTFNQLRKHDGNLWYGMFQFEGRGYARYQLADLPILGAVNADSREKAVSIARAVDSDLALVYEGLSMGYDDDIGMSGLRGDMFIFTRSINGTPVVWTSKECYAYDNFGDTYNLKTPYESMTIIIDRQDGSVWFQWQAPHTIDIASGQAASLLPFNQIMTIAAQLLPLKYQFQEQYLSLKLEEQVQDKDWILENYLNTINLGSNTLGVQAAANKYFGKDVSELTLSESAVIAGVTQNPYGYDPIRFPEKNEERRERVLDAMLRLEYITQAQYDECMADPVYDRIASYNVENPDSYNTYFVDAMIEDVLNDLIEKKGYSESDAYKMIYQGGLTIISTQNMEMQTICDEEANDPDNYPSDPKYSFNLYFSVKKADGTTKNYSHQTMLSYYKKVNNNAEYDITYKTEEECYEAIEEYEQDMLEEGDTLVEDSESIVITLQPQVAFTVIDHNTGEVKALVGGRGDKVGNRTWNRATDTVRQPGSTFKIIGCYAAALDAGGLTLASVQDDAPFTAGEKTYKNYDNTFHGWTTIREAITGSYNITTVKTLEQIGAGLAYEYALKFGFTTLVDGDRNLSLGLGGLTQGVTNLELTAAYAAIANGGEYIEPCFYTEVYDHDGNLILDNTAQETHQVISEETAWLLTDAMRDVMTSGTGKRAYFGASMDQAGKSGTTTANRDTLFAGYTPYYTCVVWGGNDDNSQQSGSLCTYSKNIWREAMKRIHADLDYKTFEKPREIVTAEVCKESGKIGTAGVCDLCQKGNAIYTEYFASGTVPVEQCDHHIMLNICATTGLISTATCPSIYIVPKVFLIGGSIETNDAPFIATEEFLATTCPHSPVPITPTPPTPTSDPLGTGQ